jgi:hypothetical protein
MSERDMNPPPGADFPSTTGEFRARPDISASTAEFQAFASGGVETERARGRTRMTLIAAVVAAIAVIVILIVALGH